MAWGRVIAVVDDSVTLTVTQAVPCFATGNPLRLVIEFMVRETQAAYPTGFIKE